MKQPGNNQEGTYPTEERFTLAEAPGLRVRQLSLGAGQCVPWHYHNEITDTLVCLKGPMSVFRTTCQPTIEFACLHQLANNRRHALALIAVRQASISGAEVVDCMCRV